MADKTGYEKILTGWRIYRVELDDINTKIKHDKIPVDWKDEEFIAESERQGHVYTLEGFENAFNESGVNEYASYIRIIKVDKDAD